MSEKEQTTLKVIPVSGIVSIQNLADFLNTPASNLQERLSSHGIKTLSLSDRFTQRFVSLADIANAIGRGAHEVIDVR